LLACLSCTAFAGPEGGSDGGHTGGGGTFIRSVFSKKLQLWDLFQAGMMKDETPGDRLSPG